MGVGRFEFERAIRALPIRPPTRKLVALMVGSYADKDGTNAHPGEDRLAEECGISPRAVRGHLAALREVGLLERTYNGSAAGRRRLADEYALDVPADVLARIRASDHRKPSSGDESPITGTSASDHRNLSTDHRNLSVDITGSQLPPTSTCTKDVDHTSPNPTHPSTSTTEVRGEPGREYLSSERDAIQLCPECGSIKFTIDGDCVPCGSRRGLESEAAS